MSCNIPHIPHPEGILEGAEGQKPSLGLEEACGSFERLSLNAVITGTNYYTISTP